MDQIITDNTEEALIKSETNIQAAYSKQLSSDLDTNLVELVPNNTGPPGYKCKVCQVFYPRKWHMKLHIRIHTGEKPYICDYDNCGKAFSRPGTLSEHKRRNHEKVLQHVCPICEKRFYGRSDMLTHIVIHDEARQQRERFLPSQMRNLLDEVEEFSFDGKVIMSNCVCNQCGKIFDKRGGKERHVNNVHLKQSKSVFKQSDDIDSNNGGSACISKYEDIKVEIDPASLKCEPFDLHCLEGDFGLKEEDIKKVNLVPKNPEIKEDVIPAKST